MRKAWTHIAFGSESSARRKLASMRFCLFGSLASHSRVPLPQYDSLPTFRCALCAVKREFAVLDPRMHTGRRPSSSCSANTIAGALKTDRAASQNDVLVPISDLRNLVRESVRAEGHSEGDADIITDVRDP